MIHRSPLAACSRVPARWCRCRLRSGARPSSGRSVGADSSTSTTSTSTTSTTLATPTTTTEAPRVRSPSRSEATCTANRRCATCSPAARTRSPRVAPTLAAADVAVVNLETAVGSTGEPRDKQFVFQADPACCPRSWTPASTSSASRTTTPSTTASTGSSRPSTTSRPSGLTATGGGRNAVEAYAPAIRRVGGVEVAIIGIAVIGPERWRPGRRRPARLDQRPRREGDRPTAIAAARGTHADRRRGRALGRRARAVPRPAERALAQRMLDAGASVGRRRAPARAAGRRGREGRLVAYSIGNFVFAGRSEQTREHRCADRHRRARWHGSSITHGSLRASMTPAGRSP